MLGDQIKSMRMASGISQQEMANRLNVSKQSVSNWENDNIVPSVNVLRKICKLFSCSADYLLELSDQEQLILDISNLSARQIAHVRLIAEELSEMNQQLLEARAEAASAYALAGRTPTAGGNETGRDK